MKRLVLSAASMVGATFFAFSDGTAAPAPPAPAAPPASAPSAYGVYVTNELSGALSVIDEARRAVVASYPVGERPRGLRLGLDGRTFYIALSGAPPRSHGATPPQRSDEDRAKDGIAVFDIAERKVLRTIKGVPDPEQIAIGGDGKIYVASEEASALFVLDGPSGRVLRQIQVGAEPEGVALSRDGRWVYVTSEAEDDVAIVDTATLNTVNKIKVGKRPRAVAFSNDGLRAYVPGESDRSVVVIDTVAQAVSNRVTLPGEDYLPMDVVVSPDDRWIYVSTGRGGEVVKLDARTLVGFSSVETGGRPWGMALSEDGQRLYAATGAGENVAVIDTTSMTRLANIPAGGGPWGVAVAPLMAN